MAGISSNRFLILATQEGIVRSPIRPNGTLGDFEHTLQDVALEAVTQDPEGTLFAGSDEGHIYRSYDRGQNWLQVFKGFPDSLGLWSLVAHPVIPKEIYAGLEPASLWVSQDGGDHWTELTVLRNHPSSKKWYFFNPAKPHVRAIAFDKKRGRLCIGIEVGGLLVSHNGGESFEDRSLGVDEDIHAIYVAPDNPDQIFAATGDGLYRSRDSGNSWQKLTNGLDRWYMIPLTFLSDNPGHICIGAGNRPPPAWQTRGADAAIYFSNDGGDSFQITKGPFPLHGMVSAITTDPENPCHLFAATTDGLLILSSDGGKGWKVAVSKLPRIEEMVIISYR